MVIIDYNEWLYHLLWSIILFNILNKTSCNRQIKAFLKLRDHNPVFDEAKKAGAAGIPCFVLEDGSVTLIPEEAGLQSRPIEGTACNIDGSGC